MYCFKLDENLPARAAILLNEGGHDALTVDDQDMRGIKDPQLIQVVNTEKRILVTLDKDFCDIRTYVPSQHHGIIVLRLKQLDSEAVMRVLQRLLSMLKTEPIHGHLWIADEANVRIRSDL